MVQQQLLKENEWIKCIKGRHDDMVITGKYYRVLKSRGYDPEHLVGMVTVLTEKGFPFDLLLHRFQPESEFERKVREAADGRSENT